VEAELKRFQALIFEALTEIVPELASKTVLVISGKKTLASLGGPAVFDLFFPAESVQYWNYSEKFVTVEEADSLVSVIRSVKPDALIGFGGGVAMDYAKIASAWSNLESIPLREQDPSEWSSRRSLGLPVVLIPTLFGSGAEATFHSVIYKESSKYSMAFEPSKDLRAVLVPELAIEATIQNRLFAALDAVCQGIETTWSRKATPRSREKSLEGLGLVLSQFSNYIHGDMASMQVFALGANIIGDSMNTGKTTAPHALSYFLTSRLQLPHGHAVAILMKHFWAYMGSQMFQSTAPEKLRETMNEISQVFKDALSSDSSIDEWLDSIAQEYSLNMDLSYLLSANNLAVADFIYSVDTERLGNHPVDLSFEDIRLTLHLNQ
jgi:alcohol dehydrogenase